MLLQFRSSRGDTCLVLYFAGLFAGDGRLCCGMMGPWASILSCDSAKPRYQLLKWKSSLDAQHKSDFFERKLDFRICHLAGFPANLPSERDFCGPLVSFALRQLENPIVHCVWLVPIV